MSTLLSFSSIIQYVGYIIIAILVLLLMVLIHELGHYVAGKILKFKINEFSVGFGPKILQKTKKNGEKISLRAFPLGGYCAFEGENEDGSTSPEAFNNQKPWKRLIVLFSGAFFNFLSAIVFSFILLISCGYDFVKVDSIGNNSINYSYLQEGDVIYGVDYTNIDFVGDNYFSTLISDACERKYATYDVESLQADADYSYIKEEKTYYMITQDLAYNVKRDNENMVVDAKINVIYNAEGKFSGWSMLSTESSNNDEFAIETYKYNFGEAITQAVPFTCKWAWKVLVIFGQLITGQLSITSLTGPVGTINMIATQTQVNASNLVLMLPLIAVNLAVFNLLPIPALDGFQMLFTGIEWARKKPVKPSIINAVNNIGLLVLLGFVIFVDVLHLIL